MDGFEKQPGLYGAIVGVIGFIFGHIQVIEPWIRIIVMLVTALAAVAGFLYNLEKWRQIRNERLKREASDVK